MSPWAKYFLSAILFIRSLLCSGQTIPYQHFSVAEGLPSSEVYYVYQDKKGFIWFATDNGVVRFDGKDMDVYQLNEGLSDPVVFSFFEDDQDRIWFRTYSGKLSYFKDEQIHSYQFNDLLAPLCKRSYLQSIVVDGQNNLWFSSLKDFGFIDPSGSLKKEAVTSSNLILKKIGNHMAYYRPDGLPTNLNQITANGMTIPFKMPVSSINRHPIVLPFHRNGEDYFSMGSIIYKIEKEKVVPVFFGRDQIISLRVDRHNYIWIGYFENGIERLVNFNEQSIINLPFLQSKGITCITEDNQGGFWFGTRQDGAYYVPELDYVTLTLPVHAKINAAISWDNQTLIGDDHGKLFLLNKEGEIKDQFRTGEITLAIGHPDSTNIFWVSTSPNTYIFDKFFHVKKRFAHTNTDLCKDISSGVWGVMGPHIFHYSLDGKTLSDFVVDNFTRRVYCTKSYVVTFGRIGMNANSNTPPHKKITLPRPFNEIKVSQVLSLNDSMILVGTLGSGFFIVNENNWTSQNYFLKSGFNANNIYACKLINSNVWLGTEKGIAITTIHDLLTRPKFNFITKKNGLVNDRVNYLTNSDHRVWAYSDNSICIIPENPRPQSLPLCYLQKMVVNNSRYPVSSDIRLDHDQNNIEFFYRFIDLKNQNIFIRHRLSQNDIWSYSNERNVQYYSLSPDSYSFELEYSLDNVNWVKGEWVNFTISLPWWRAWYFQVPLFALLAFSAISYYRRRLFRLRERHNYLKIINEQQQNLIRAELETMERERNRIAKELHDSVGTNLSAIKMTIRRLMQKYNEPKSDLIEGDLQQTIQEIKDIIHELVPAGLTTFGLTETIRNRAKKIKENLGLDIEVLSFGPEIKESNLSLTSFRILQELLSNSLKHSKANKVIIHINSFDDILNIIYQDDGIGFEANSITPGSGLLNIQSRIQTAGGNLKFESGNFGVFYSIDLPLKK